MQHYNQSTLKEANRVWKREWDKLQEYLAGSGHEVFSDCGRKFIRRKDKTRIDESDDPADLRALMHFWYYQGIVDGLLTNVPYFFLHNPEEK